MGQVDNAIMVVIIVVLTRLVAMRVSTDVDSGEEFFRNY